MPLHFILFLNDKCNPRYLIGQVPNENPVLARISAWVVSSIPAKKMLELSTLATRPLASLKWFIAFISLAMELQPPLQIPLADLF